MKDVCKKRMKLNRNWKGSASIFEWIYSFICNGSNGKSEIKMPRTLIYTVWCDMQKSSYWLESNKNYISCCIVRTIY